MPRERNHESGQYRETITDAEILDFIKAHDRPFITANDLIKHTQLGRTRANDRLNQLAADERLEKTGVGAHAAVWWLADEQERRHDRESAISLVRNPVTGDLERLSELPESGYKRRFLEQLGENQRADMVDIGGSPVLSFDKDRWRLEDKEKQVFLVKREAETDLDEMVLDEGEP